MQDSEQTFKVLNFPPPLNIVQALFINLFLRFRHKLRIEKSY